MVAVAYRYSDSGYKPMDYAFSSIDPALGVLTTAGDMERLMIAHLDSRSAFLNERSRNYMHELQFTDEPRLGFGATCGLFECRRGAWRYLFSLGYALGFQSMLYLIPDRQIGLFVSQNRTGELVFTLEDLQKFISAEEAPKDSPPELLDKRNFESNAKAVVGKYTLTRTMSSGDGERDYVLVSYLP